MQEPLTHGSAATPTVCGLFHTMPGHQRVSALQRGESDREIFFSVLRVNCNYNNDSIQEGV